MKREEIIEQILELGKEDERIMPALENGENIAEILREKALIFPIEYDNLLERETGDLGDFIEDLHDIVTLIRSKQEKHTLYSEYCKFFLGETVNYIDLAIIKDGTYRPFQYYDLRDEEGYIDYSEYLKEAKSRKSVQYSIK